MQAQSGWIFKQTRFFPSRKPTTPFSPATTANVAGQCRLHMTIWFIASLQQRYSSEKQRTRGFVHSYTAHQWGKSQPLDGSDAKKCGFQAQWWLRSVCLVWQTEHLVTSPPRRSRPTFCLCSLVPSFILYFFISYFH